MTFGIDVASSQAAIDLVRAKAEGVQFVIVKMGGLNVTPQYVAPYYRAQVDRAVAAGLPKGHYYLIGKGQTPEAQAEFFVNNLYRFDKSSDVLALDNEALDSNGTKWGDGEAARFVSRVLELTGIPANRVWHYAGAGDYRAVGSWPQLAALGVRFWWAAYGDYPSGQVPDHEPSLQGSIPRWDVHQFSSKSRVAGFELDGNYTPHSVATLFGGGPVSLEDQMRQFIAANLKPVDAATWDQMCGSLMFRFNSWRGWVTQPFRDISSAYRVAMGSGQLNGDFMRAPVGAWHYFDIAGEGNGHVMQDARGGGLVCLSTGYALSEPIGKAIGFQSVPGYVSAKGARYMGWATNYAGGTIDVAGLSGGGYTSVEDDMTPEQSRKLDAVYAGLFGPANINIPKMTWARPFGEAPGEAFYGVLDIIIRNQAVIAEVSGKVSGLSKALEQVGSGTIDMGAVSAAAAAGARDALSALGFPTVEAIADAVVDEQRDRLTD